MNTAPARAAWWACAAALTLILLAPLVITDVPPVLDYPNHLARLVLLATGPDDPMLGRIFTAEWANIPNLAGDVIGLELLHLFPIHTTGRCLLGGVLLLNLAGVLALHRAWSGRRSFWPLGSGLVGYNSGFLLGFLNWQIGCGLAMLFAAVWMIWREHRPIATIAGAAAAAVVLFFCHLLGLVFFLVLIGSAELHAMRNPRAIFVRSVGLLAVLSGPILLSMRTTLRDAPAATQWPLWHVKLENTASPFINYIFPLDMITAALVYGGIAAGVARGWLILTPRAMAAAFTLPIAYFVFPFDLMSGSFLDMRVAIMFGFLMFAAVDPAPRMSWHFRVAAAVCIVLFAARMAVVARVWTDGRRDLEELRGVIASVPPGAKVYFTNVPPEEAPAYWDASPWARRLSNGLRADYHLPALLLIERGAFWPVLFANPAQQPIRLRPDYATLAREAHDIPPHARLVADPDLVLPALLDFDYVLMLEAGADQEPFLPGCLTLVSRSDFAALFKVRHDATTCVGPR